MRCWCGCARRCLPRRSWYGVEAVGRYHRPPATPEGCYRVELSTAHVSAVRVNGHRAALVTMDRDERALNAACAGDHAQRWLCIKIRAWSLPARPWRESPMARGLLVPHADRRSVLEQFLRQQLPKSAEWHFLSRWPFSVNARRSSTGGTVAHGSGRFGSGRRDGWLRRPAACSAGYSPVSRQTPPRWVRALACPSRSPRSR
jgi:hypothetical protein